MFLQLLLSGIFAIGNFFAQPVYAEGEALLFWGTTCPYCHVVREEIGERGLDEKVEITELEIYENKGNLKIFQEKVSECKIEANKAGVPMLYSNGECFMGVNPILTKLAQLADVDLGEVGETENGVEEVSEDEDKGKKNTEILIWIGVLSLLLFVLVGYFIQRGKGGEVVTVFLVFLFSFFFTNQTYAMCPICTAAVGAGLGLSRYFGIDDVITGVWIGGLIVSSIMWFLGWLEKRNIKSVLSKVLTVVVMYAFLGLTLYLLDFVENPLNMLWGIDKILLGIVTGSIMFFLFAKLHLYLKEKNNGKVYIPFQKVVFTVGSLLLLTIFFYMLVY
jgi:hypothetical protein